MEKYTGFEIAVIGLAGRFPKADTVGQYWENLKHGKDCISAFSEADALAAGEAEALVKDPQYVKASACLENKQYFDSEFFGYRPDEAELMDPQVRVFHECCWEALEDSGYGNAQPKDKIGLFASGSPNLNWELYAVLKNQAGLVDDFTAMLLRGITGLSTRISYKLNLKGPSVYLQTACSSSLVAIHQAVNSLLWGECSMALAGGVTVTNSSRKGYLYQEGLILSRDGKCRPFDADASGTIGGEGAGVVVLKRLKDALRDRDQVYAVIKGTGINNDGNRKVGYTAPSARGQADAIRKAHKMAGVKPESITYVEAHGTATGLGDPIEVEALNEAFGSSQAKYCAIGSVKSNIGHLDSAAGVAGFIKAVLAVKHAQIPASLHFSRPNPEIDFDGGPFYVNSRLQQWHNPAGPLRAGVSSFGIGGTNAHVVIEEAPVPEPSGASREYQLLVWSARTQPSLERSTVRLLEYLKREHAAGLPDVACTLQKGRVRFAHRNVLVCRNREEAVALLETGGPVACTATDPLEELQHVVFMFPGQGAQYADMGKDLYLHEQVFRGQVDECLGLARAYSSADFGAVLFSGPGPAVDPRTINGTQYAQPLLFIVEYALARLLMHWGVKPDYMIGHSIGEYVAACLSGVLSLEDALRLVIRRGELMSRAEGGSMLSISAGPEALGPLLAAHPEVELAVINGAASSVVAGRDNNIAAFGGLVREAGYEAQKLHTSHAFHSRMMEGVLDQFEREVAAVTIRPPAIPYISNVTGELARYDDIKKPAYWSRQLRSTVQFLKGTGTLLAKGSAAFVEVGPGRSLLNHVGGNAALTRGHRLTGTLRQANQHVNDQQYLTEKLGWLWLAGVQIDWDGYYSGEKRGKVALPTYSFEKTPYTADVDARTLLTSPRPAAPPVDAGNGSPAECIHVAGWQRAEAPEAAGEGQDGKRVFLVFADRGGFSNYLAEDLLAAGHRVIRAMPGPRFREMQPGVYEVDLAEPAALWSGLAEAGTLVNHVVYCPALRKELGEVTYEAIAEKLGDGYLGLSALAKAMAAVQPTGTVHLTVINNHLAGVTRADAVDPLKATVLGPAKVIPLEILHVKTRVVDIPYPFGSEGELRECARLVLNELMHDAEDAFVAYRYGERWVPAFAVLGESGKIKSNVEIVDGGVYVITGGLGGMGFTIASDLVLRHGANVVLVHRSDFPARGDWADWLARRGEEDAVSKKIIRLLALESTGRRVDLYRVDLAVEAQVQQLAADVKKKYPAVNGLVWAAGEVDYGGIIQNRKQQDFIKPISSKVQGLLLFQQYLGFQALDFVALFSSFANQLYQVKFGQVGYNAANEFLESYPLYARQITGAHVFTINWCDWLDVGMTVNVRLKEAATADVGAVNTGILHGITPAEGVAVFHRCLGSKLAAAAVFKGDLNGAIRAHRAGYNQTKAALAAPDVLAAAPGAGKTTPAAQLTEIFARFFGKETIGADDSFFELGGDSLKGMTLVARINQQTGAKLSIGDLYRCPTTRQMAALLGQSAKTAAAHIPKAPAQERYRLSSAQKRMYFLQAMDPGSTVYNEAQVLRITGKLDAQKLERTFRLLIRRHESLRTAFVFSNEAPGQRVLEEFSFGVRKLADPGNDPDEVIRSFVRPFDLGQAPLCRVGLVEKGPEEHLLVIDLHHIVVDGISQSVLIRDFIALYNGKALPELHLHYKDYAEWQQGEEQQREISRQKDFWLDAFSREVAVLDLPADFPRPLVKSYRGKSLAFGLAPAEKTALKALAEAEGTSLYTVLLACFAVLLGKLGNQEDIVVGTPVAGRQHSDVEDMIGLFMNTLPLRINLRDGLGFRAFLAELKAGTLACFDNQAYPYEELIEKLQVTRDTGRNPLFDVLFSFISFDKPVLDIPGLVLEPYQGGRNVSKLDLTLWAFDAPETINCLFEYATDLFRPETIARFAHYFRAIIAAVVADADVNIAGIGIVGGAEQERLLAAFNDTRGPCPAGETVVALFEKQVRRTPAKTAFVYEGTQLTYQALNARANQLAHCLREEHQVRPGDFVAIMSERSERMLIGLLGILKAGGAYVPIDPAYPKERIAYILEDSRAAVLLVSGPLPGDFDYRGKAVSLDGGAHYPVTDPVPAGDPAGLCYLIYTSGSTGKPKGVMVTHSNVVNFCAAMSRQLPCSENDCMLAVTSISFDISVLELFWTLCNGVQVVLHPAGVSLDSLDRYVAGEDTGRPAPLHAPITMLQSTPSFIKMTREGTGSGKFLRSLRLLLLGGEAVPAALVRNLQRDTGATIFNMYGPTETTVWSCVHQFEPGVQKVSVGKPILNTQVYILNKALQLVPEGVAGDLYIGGAGLARGYWQREDLTRERFIDHPFGAGNKIYDTGDVARWLPGGQLELIGREDHQVKVSGYRIELGEIESQLLLLTQIKEAAVLAKDAEGAGKYLVGYLVAGEPLDMAAVRDHLDKRLPGYMIPAHFLQLDLMPLTPNGKTDRKALVMVETTPGNAYAPLSGPTEEKLLAIWADVLKLDKRQISVKSSFFELGGHSIRAIHLNNQLHEAFSVKIELRDIFEYNSIEKLARRIEHLGAARAVRIVPAEKREYYPVSSAQERLFYQHTLHKDRLNYNVSGIYRITGDSDAGRLEDTFRALINRHEGLRTAFAFVGGNVVQRVYEHAGFELRIIEPAGYRTGQEAIRDFFRPFDLSAGPLIRGGLLRHEAYGHLLLVDIHHVVCDGTSLNLLMNEFKSIYQGRAPAPPGLRYVDYAHWQQRQTRFLKKQEAFWANQLSGELPRIDLPVLQDREDASIYEAGYEVLEISGDLYAKAKRFAAQSNVSDFMFLLSVYSVLLAKLSASSDMIVGTDAIGRTQPALGNVVGAFVNVLPLRLRVLPGGAYRECLGMVKTAVLEAFDNQDLPFDQIVALHAGGKRQLVDVYFSFVNFLEESRAQESPDFVPFEAGDQPRTARYELELAVTEKAGRFSICFLYSTALYDRETIRLFIAYYRNILTTVLDDASVPVGAIALEKRAVPLLKD